MKQTNALTYIILSAMAAGCGDLPQPVVPGSLQTNTDSQPKTLKPEPPDISNTTPTFGYSSMPLRGTAEKDTVVIIDGGSARTAADVGATGTFCADVALKQGKNTLKLFAQRVDSSYSDTITYTVTYDPSTAPDDSGTTQTPQQTTGEVRDVARGKGVGSSISTTNPAAMTDGDDGTYSTFSDYPSIYIDLGKTYSVQKIEVVFSASADTSGRYADQYDLFTSLQASPTRPIDTTTPGWSVVASVVGDSGGNGDGGTDTFEVGTPITARWVGLTVNHVATGVFSFDWSVEVASIRVSAPEIIDTGGSGPVGPPTCDNGGN